MQQEQDTSDLTIVTAFFDIGRSEFKDFTRKNIEYFNYFKFWAGIKNNLVVYTQPEFKNEVLKIRQEKGLLDKTIVITCNLEDIDLELYNVFKETFEKYPQTWRKQSKKVSPETVSFKYCYINCMKSFFVCNAINSNLILTKKVMWLDFGYNHGGDFYTDGSQFDFYLSFKKSYDQDKLIIYKMGNDTNKSMAQIYYDMSVLYIGPQLYGSSQAWIIFNKHMKKSVISFAKKGIADDDQFYMLDVVRNYPRFYQIEDCCMWFDALLDFIPTKNCKLLTMSNQAYKNNYSMLYEKISKETSKIIQLLIKMRLIFFKKRLKREYTQVIHQQIKNKF